MAATRPGSSQLAVEVDAALADLVRRRLPLRGVRVRIGDARAVLERLRACFFDVVIADVFAGGRTPAHLTTVEFMQAVRGALSSGGVFAANVADGAPLAHARAQVATARTVFPQVGLIADAAALRGRRFGNLVLVASPEPLPAAALTRLTAADPMPGRVLYGEDLTRVTAGAKLVTDASARPSPERARAMPSRCYRRREVRAAGRRPGRLSRLARTRTETWIGLPSKPNSSRSRRSTNRR